MIGILLIYFVGKAFYDLAGTYRKNQWLFAILGVASYYVGTFGAGITIGILMGMGYLDSLEGTNELVLGLIALPFGVLLCWGFYKFLENRFKNETPDYDDNKTLDGDGLDNNRRY